MPLETLIVAGTVAIVAVIAVVPVVVRHRRHDRRIREKLERARRLGTGETLSLHPVIDEGKCIGCEECVRGCPEQDVLATYRHKAVVVDAVECVGHGICERVCPVGAVTLVVGTETRGLELPKLTEHFETNVPGLYVVGELGGMGLIRNAIWQAAQAVEHIHSRPRPVPSGGVELLVVGAGPAGLAAALAALESRISFRIIDQEAIGGSMLHYPRRKLVMTHPAALPGIVSAVGGVVAASEPMGAPPGAQGDCGGHSVGSRGTTTIMITYIHRVTVPVSSIDRNQMIRTMTGSTSR